MATLSSSIVKRGVASMKDVEEALARQVLYGGDLATNLLELAAVSEADLTGLLAENHSLEPAPIGELPRSNSATLGLLPGDVARRHGVYPLEERDGTLVVAVSEPLPREVEEDLGFALGVGIEQRAAPQVRILQAIARDYGVAMDRRTLRLVAKLSGRPDPSPSSLPPRDGSHAPVSLPRPPSLPPLAYPSGSGPELDAQQTGPVSLRSAAVARETQDAKPAPVQHSVAPAPEFAAWASSASKPPRRRARRRGPYTAATAEQDLLSAGSRDDVLRASFDFIAQYFEYSALFAVHGDIAEGRDARGRGANRARITGVGVPLDLPGALATARDERTFQLVRLGNEGIDAALAKDLSRKSGRVVLLLPIAVRGRCVLIVYGDFGDADVELSEIGGVIAFAPLVSAALERVIMLRKRGNRDGVSATPPPVRVRPRRAPKPSLDERAAALAEALALPARSPAPPPAAPAPEPKKRSTLVSSPAPPARASSAPRPPDAGDRVEPNRTVNVGTTEPHRPPSDGAIARPVISVGGDRRVSTPPQGTPAAIESDRPGDLTPVFPLTRRSTPSPARLDDEEPPEDGWDVASARPAFSDEESATRPGVGSIRPKPTSPGLGKEAPAARQEGSNPKLELVPETALDESEGPEISVSEADVDEDDLVESDRRPTGTMRRDEAPLAPASRSVAYGPRRLQPRHSSTELKLPSVIVDVESDCRDLVARLLKGEEEASDKLVDLGQAAISALVAQFPGPINAEPRRGDGPMRASDCGPILRTLARMGSSAVPYLVVRTADSSPDVRSWATRLLGEMPTVESAKAVVRRLVDPDPDVHKSALAAGRLLVADPEARTALRDGLSALAADGSQSDEVRHAAIEALADLREARAVPRMARLLEDSNGDIVKSAHWALVVLTRQDFSRDLGQWLGWWETHASQHRIEWLIDALMHETPDIRRSAGDELKSLTKEYFGYYDDLPRKERLRAQERYREWWESKGKARFPRI